MVVGWGPVQASPDLETAKPLRKAQTSEAEEGGQEKKKTKKGEKTMGGKEKKMEVKNKKQQRRGWDDWRAKGAFFFFRRAPPGLRVGSIGRGKGEGLEVRAAAHVFLFVRGRRGGARRRVRHQSSRRSISTPFWLAVFI